MKTTMETKEDLADFLGIYVMAIIGFTFPFASWSCVEAPRKRSVITPRRRGGCPAPLTFILGLLLRRLLYSPLEISFP
jgi:hypothetical protein